MVGITVTKAEVDATAGGVARELHLAMRHAGEFKAWLDAQADATLKALGYSDGSVEAADNDIATLRSAFADAAQLVDIWQGVVVLVAVKDFRAFLRRLAGLNGV